MRTDFQRPENLLQFATTLVKAQGRRDALRVHLNITKGCKHRPSKRGRKGPVAHLLGKQNLARLRDTLARDRETFSDTRNWSKKS